jgi:signal transduction histidine kinase
LARACRARGAGERAADFYRKAIAEASDANVIDAARRELSSLSIEIGDPFAAPSESRPWWWLGAVLCAGVIALTLWWLRRRRHTDVDALLARHPERAASFRYACGVLQHELLKHRLAPLRNAGRESTAPMDPLHSAWRRHLDALAAALGVAPPSLLAHPRFAAANRAMNSLVAVESTGQAAPEPALAALRALDRQLTAWGKVGERCVIDGALFDQLLDSLRDERAGRRLPVQIDVECLASPPWVNVFFYDLLLVLRNLVRNAMAAAEATGATTVRIDVRILLDETAQEWVRVAIHDTSPARPPSDAAPERGIGLVRATLERYGGALLEVQPALGYAKALAMSVPLLETEPSTVAERRAA